MNPVGVYVKLGKKIPTNVTVSGMIDDEEEDKTKKEKEKEGKADKADKKEKDAVAEKVAEAASQNKIDSKK